MQLTYRGQTYTCDNHTVEMMETGLKGLYRGTAYSLQRGLGYSQHEGVYLKYRGVAYVQTGR